MTFFLLQYPWLVSIGVFDGINNKYEHFCTGSIVNRKFVLTAAHCFDESRSNNFAGQTVLLAGTTDVNKRRDDEHKFFAIQNQITHPKYNARK